jgi:hypothetical protein
MPHRLTVVILTVVILVGLLIWQDQRWRLVEQCASRGGVWDGARSKCRRAPIRILIEKNLKRSGY